MMTADEVRQLLDQAGLSQREAARALDVNERTMRYYCLGEWPVPKKIEYALRWLAHLAAQQPAQ